MTNFWDVLKAPFELVLGALFFVFILVMIAIFVAPVALVVLMILPFAAVYYIVKAIMRK